LLDAALLVVFFSGACFAETSRYSGRFTDFFGFLDMDVYIST
jgi:hypothetical protein